MLSRACFTFCISAGLMTHSHRKAVGSFNPERDCCAFFRPELTQFDSVQGDGLIKQAMIFFLRMKLITQT